MIVWLPRSEATARPTPLPTIATTAKLTASTPVEGRGKSPVSSNQKTAASDTVAGPVETADAYGVARDAFNHVSFKPVATGALRLEVAMQPAFSAGLQEWTVK